MQAVILAAGMGRRLKHLTQNNTKCMVKVNGCPLIDRLLHQLERKNLSRIVIVVGYESEGLINYIDNTVRKGISTPIVYIENPIFDKTNNIYSLALAKEYLVEEDTLLFESDLIFEDAVIDAIIDDPREDLALVDRYESWMDGTCVRLDDEDNIIAFIPGKQFDFADIDRYYKTVNIYKFSKDFSASLYVPFLEAYCSALGNNEYYEQVLRVIAMLDNPRIKGKRLEGQLWYEIDDVQDLDIASSLFATDKEKKLNMIQTRYGGYWRYSKMIDFCYLVNPYFPPQKMIDEIKANFEKLLTQYPSGMKVNSLLASKNFEVNQENIVVGNGAAELIKSLMTEFTGKIGVVRPTFEEYPNRYSADLLVVYTPKNDNLAYSADDLIQYFGDKQIETLLIINPDNPTGNYITKTNMIRLIEWTASMNIRIVVDESFVDFAEESDSSLIEQGILDTYPHLFVMKSISKSFGVPGLRLGVLASGDIACIDRIKKDVPIWNINSFAEYYMQIFEKYRKDYISAKETFCAERRRFISRLKEVEGIRVIPSSANYVMVELTDGTTSIELTRDLLCEHNIFIKDLSEKVKMDGRQFVRIAIRDTGDNDRLIEALESLRKRQ